MYIDATVIKGMTTSKSCHIEVKDSGTKFAPLDLNGYAVRLRILGSATADAEVLVEHIITQNTDVNVDGVIDNPNGGDFILTINKEDTEILGVGNHPISLQLLNAEDLIVEYNLTEGGQKGEFSKIQVVQV